MHAVLFPSFHFPHITPLQLPNKSSAVCTGFPNYLQTGCWLAKTQPLGWPVQHSSPLPGRDRSLQVSGNCFYTSWSSKVAWGTQNVLYQQIFWWEVSVFTPHRQGKNLPGPALRPRAYTGPWSLLWNSSHRGTPWSVREAVGIGPCQRLSSIRAQSGSLPAPQREVSRCLAKGVIQSGDSSLSNQAKDW